MLFAGGEGGMMDDFNEGGHDETARNLLASVGGVGVSPVMHAENRMQPQQKQQETEEDELALMWPSRQ